jgi:transcription elongation factor Elf1
LGKKQWKWKINFKQHRAILRTIVMKCLHCDVHDSWVCSVVAVVAVAAVAAGAA